MAWIEKRKRGDGGVSARVVWRLGGTRDACSSPAGVALGELARDLEQRARQVAEFVTRGA